MTFDSDGFLKSMFPGARSMFNSGFPTIPVIPSYEVTKAMDAADLVSRGRKESERTLRELNVSFEREKRLRETLMEMENSRRIRQSRPIKGVSESLNEYDISKIISSFSSKSLLGSLDSSGISSGSQKSREYICDVCGNQSECTRTPTSGCYDLYRKWKAD